jgi:hypothetical protein
MRKDALLLVRGLVAASLLWVVHAPRLTAG